MEFALKVREFVTEFQEMGKVREFCCLKVIFRQVKDPNFENCLREHAPRPPK